MARIKSAFERWTEQPWTDGDGLHNDIFVATCFLIEEGQTEDSIFEILRNAANEVDERYVPDRELRSAINYAIAKKNGNVISISRPAVDPAFQQEVISCHTPNMDLLRHNAQNLDQNPVSYLKQLYKPGELICAAADTWNWQTLPLEELLEIASKYRLEFINPSPMSAYSGVTLEGKTSTHCIENTGPRVYLAIEFDMATIKQQVSFHKFLSTRYPLVLLLFSGNKSIHGWYFVEGEDADKVDRFFDLACLLGADPKTWGVSQFVRMPGGWNNKAETNQKVLYFNPTRH